MTQVFLPQVLGNATVAAQGEHTMSPRAQAFADAWLSLLSPERRTLMRYDSRLAMCAQMHAQYLAQRTGDQLLQSMHIGLLGSYSNWRVVASGYDLPSEYSPFKNNVESCARDSDDPAAVAVRLAGHEPHRSHMLGINGFEDRTVWAVGNAADDWVFLACPPEGN